MSDVYGWDNVVRLTKDSGELQDLTSPDDVSAMVHTLSNY